MQVAVTMAARPTTASKNPKSCIPELAITHQQQQQ
jgi:hypothetical protein